MTDGPTPERDQLLLPYSAERIASQRRGMARAIEPNTVSGYVRWIRWAYRQEPPVALHDRDELADDGTPRWTGDFMAWISGTTLKGGISCGEDDEGYLRTPLRCALYTMHGRFENAPSAKMADFLLSIAEGGMSVGDVAVAHGVGPAWVHEIVAREALRRLWDIYAPMRR